MLRGYRPAQILITCTQLGVFNQLAAGPHTPAELAAQLAVDPKALGRLLNAAVAHGLLIKQNERYANSSMSETCLVPGGRYHLGNLIGREGAFYQRWSYLPDAIRSGERPDANIRDEGQRNWVLDFELALYDLALAYGPDIAEALNLPEDRPLRILDVGGGHGGYSIALARRYPNVVATVFELPAAAAVALDIIAREGMNGRVSVQEGNFQEEELPGGYDIVLLFGVLVSETLEGKLALLQKAYDALVPGGQLVIRGFWLDEDRAGPPQETIFSLHMLLSTEAGDISTRSELEDLVSQVGFKLIRTVMLPRWEGAEIYVADKPN
jgi:SAM-dependent methyltransferase